MTNEPSKIVERAATGYAENTLLRASVQIIPWVGGPLDTLLAGAGTKIQNRRLNHFLSELSQRLEKIQAAPTISEEELFDLAVDAISKSVRASADQKRALFAQIVSRQIVVNEPYDQAELALRVVSELDSVHLRILAEVLNAPTAKAPYEGLRLVFVEHFQNESSDENQEIPALTNVLHDYPVGVIKLAVAELISKGLLHDEGIGRWDSKAMQQVVPTETADWLQKWLS